jgi:hypothetical protein
MALAAKHNASHLRFGSAACLVVRGKTVVPARVDAYSLPHWHRVFASIGGTWSYEEVEAACEAAVLDVVERYGDARVRAYVEALPSAHRAAVWRFIKSSAAVTAATSGSLTMAMVLDSFTSAVASRGACAVKVVLAATFLLVLQGLRGTSRGRLAVSCSHSCSPDSHRACRCSVLRPARRAAGAVRHEERRRCTGRPF